MVGRVWWAGLATVWVASGFGLGGLGHAQAAAQGPSVVVAEVRGVVNPVLAGYVERVIGHAEQTSASLLVLLLDTPGGLDSSMRGITQRILSSRVPVAVFVYPHGARAGSAGVFITYAAHIAAMAPTTNIGSAHPVALGGDGSQSMSSEMSDKVTNDAVASIRSFAELRRRNADWAEQAVRESANLASASAAELGVIDLLAEDLPDLLRRVEGRTVRLGGEDVVVSVRDAAVDRQPMSPLEAFLHAISDPTIAYLLLSIGGLAVVYELANPGAILPGVVGGVALLLALYSLGSLPINIAGIGLILFAMLLLFVDIVVAGSGFLLVGGVVSFALGSALLAISPETQSFFRVSVPVVALMTLGFGAFFTVVAGALIALRKRLPYPSPSDGLIGQIGVVKNAVDGAVVVFVGGELWQAMPLDPESPMAAGERVRVLAVEGLCLTVEPE